MTATKSRKERKGVRNLFRQIASKKDRSERKRFLTPFHDDSLNRYVYVGNNPVNFVDFTGADWILIGLGAVAAAATFWALYLGYRIAGWKGAGLVLGMIVVATVALLVLFEPDVPRTVKLGALAVGLLVVGHVLFEFILD